jgi:hypothetical protein
MRDVCLRNCMLYRRCRSCAVCIFSTHPHRSPRVTRKTSKPSNLNICASCVTSLQDCIKLLASLLLFNYNRLHILRTTHKLSYVFFTSIKDNLEDKFKYIAMHPPGRSRSRNRGIAEWKVIVFLLPHLRRAEPFNFALEGLQS